MNTENENETDPRWRPFRHTNLFHATPYENLSKADCCKVRVAARDLANGHPKPGDHVVCHRIAPDDLWLVTEKRMKHTMKEVLPGTPGPDSCPVCGGTIEGDGHTVPHHCENADPDGIEPDAPVVFCQPDPKCGQIWADHEGRRFRVFSILKAGTEGKGGPFVVYASRTGHHDVISLDQWRARFAPV